MTSQDLTTFCLDINYITCVFCLSALDPNNMKYAISNMFNVLKNNGMVLFRDYAVNDQAMLRFSKERNISDNFYARQGIYLLLLLLLLNTLITINNLLINY